MTLQLTSDRNQCAGCGEYFNSSAAFDKHRTGDHGVNRRCLSVDEMIEKGMAINHRGYWVTALMPAGYYKEESDV